MRRRVSGFLAVALCVVGAGCTDKPVAQGDLTVFAASSLTGAFGDIGKAFEAANPNTKVTFNFAASSDLVLQLQEGTPADVVALADTRTMRTVRTHATVFARNRLVIVTRPHNPDGIRSLADLPRVGVVSLCGAAVPCGTYAAQALAKAGVTLDESNVTRGQNATATLTAVSQGDAVTAIVYATDAKAAGARVTTVAIPDAVNVTASYPIAPLVSRPAARAFVAFVRGRVGRRILAKFGFMPA